ncbi:MAG: DUF1993 domain-containing protein [Hyphomonadaceae bacterium JAD_PAG50586_4]|nr:MAG: DUF1993 domain-containing protein [Hyphomonadaceae bacterium JAD_PAG50586_4]
MSKVSIYAASAPTFVRMLKNLAAMLNKAEAHAKSKNFDVTTLLNDRLAPDMFTLMRQIQIATDHAKGAMARLANQVPEAIEDKEVTLADLQARIAKVIAIVESFKPEQLEGAENREVSIKIPGSELKFDGMTYLNSWALPNFYFHATMAYAILRHNGVDLGKKDFLMS